VNVTRAPEQYASTGIGGRAEESQTWHPLFLVARDALLTVVLVLDGKLQSLDIICVTAMPFIAGRASRLGLVRLLSVTPGTWGVRQLLPDQGNGPGPRISRQLVTAATPVGVFLLTYLAGGDFTTRWKLGLNRPTPESWGRGRRHIENLRRPPEVPGVSARHTRSRSGCQGD